MRFQKNEVKNVSRIDCESCAGTLLNMSLGRVSQDSKILIRPLYVKPVALVLDTIPG